MKNKITLHKITSPVCISCPNCGVFLGEHGEDGYLSSDEEPLFFDSDILPTPSLDDRNRVYSCRFVGECFWCRENYVSISATVAPCIPDEKFINGVFHKNEVMGEEISYLAIHRKSQQKWIANCIESHLGTAIEHWFLPLSLHDIKESSLEERLSILLDDLIDFTPNNFTLP